ncbi:MAG: hypothetical protein K2X38_01235 [Gemmataceae bacterium]|nr:hypothetical protein [Gemmataceae bacterium]
MSGFIVVKVGGSLYDLPDLGVRLRRFLGELDAGRIAVVPGGGITADAIRSFDAVHRLGEESSHWLALRTLTVNAHFLAGFLPNYTVAADIRQPRVLLDAFEFVKQDETRPDPIPHIWDATSDCVAAQLAWRGDADQLVLLKSRAWPGGDWLQAADEGVVDRLFPSYAKRLGSTAIRVVCLRGPAEASG